ncbi:PREDICTED: cyclin-dependent kinase 2-associated protein 2-like [Vollenhovia emeryi]|uniref:cyclin-dependent kinase 2-associated protein 2-like n=1 Tax=Vollenhovia emeryi TaxID=411798 RepID=UPI0005F489B1|nr:PREDICTED: cyclin-dependent kinase 2-associated protein 2-like [Vollenhovia emeryi]
MTGNRAAPYPLPEKVERRKNGVNAKVTEPSTEPLLTVPKPRIPQRAAPEPGTAQRAAPEPGTAQRAAPEPGTAQCAAPKPRTSQRVAFDPRITQCPAQISFNPDLPTYTSLLLAIKELGSEVKVCYTNYKIHAEVKKQIEKARILVKQCLDEVESARKKCQ